MEFKNQILSFLLKTEELEKSNLIQVVLYSHCALILSIQRLLLLLNLGIYHIEATFIYEVSPEGIQPCTMKNRDIY